MIWSMEVIYYIGALIALIVAIYAFVRGFNVLRRFEEQQWREYFKESVETIGKVMSPSRELIHE